MTSALRPRTTVAHRREPAKTWNWREDKAGPVAEYELSVDDEGGNLTSHNHPETGHCWPMTRQELLALRRQIDAVLE